MDVADYNARWLKAWSDKDVPALLGFYAEDCRYFDPQTAQGLNGHAELGPYLTQLFAMTPPIEYRPDEVWPTESGFCGRWLCHVAGAETPALRGFDLVVLDGDKIALNEVYTHTLAAAPTAG